MKNIWGKTLFIFCLVGTPLSAFAREADFTMLETKLVGEVFDGRTEKLNQEHAKAMVHFFETFKSSANNDIRDKILAKLGEEQSNWFSNYQMKKGWLLGHHAGHEPWAFTSEEQEAALSILQGAEI